MPRYSLKLRPWIQDQLARALVGAGEQVADHRRAGADGERLDDVAGVADAAVGDDRDAVCGAAARAHSMTAVIIGTPMPATMRVVQIEPRRCRP